MLTDEKLLLNKNRNARFFFFFFRWAQFFIHPLMIRDAIDREVEAVDSGKRSGNICLTTFSFIEPVIYLAHLSSFITRPFYL